MSVSRASQIAITATACNLIAPACFSMLPMNPRKIIVNIDTQIALCRKKNDSLAVPGTEAKRQDHFPASGWRSLRKLR